MPRPCICNGAIGVDIARAADNNGATFMLFNIIDMSVGYQIVSLFRAGRGAPTRTECLDVLTQRWASWAGYPKQLIADRGLNNRGAFARELAAAGVYASSTGLEAPYQLGKAERRGGMWKTVAPRVIEQKVFTGHNRMERFVMEVNSAMNEMNRSGGFSPSQWVIGRQPRSSAAERGDDDQALQLGSVEERIDPAAFFLIARL